MRTDKACGTCGDDGYLIGDKADARGERTDDVQRCPDCNAPEDDDIDTGLFERAEQEHVERMFDVGGES